MANATNYRRDFPLAVDDFYENGELLFSPGSPGPRPEWSDAACFSDSKLFRHEANKPQEENHRSFFMLA